MLSYLKWLSRAAALGLGIGMCITAGQIRAQERTLGPLGPPVATPSEVVRPTDLSKTSGPEKSVANTTSKVEDPPPATLYGLACPGGSAWLNNPTYRLTPRLGHFYVPPTGCGYYSALDWVKGESRQGPPKNGYPPSAIISYSFFDADFRYVDSPGYQPSFLESLHRIHLGDNILAATGGEFRWRQMREFNSRLSGKNNEYDLLRSRIFGDIWYKDIVRVYVDGISAFSFNQDLAPLKIDENHADFLNAFADVKLFNFDGHNAYLRVGRQELLLGSQRLVSPLDWANTRRTFQGFRAFYQGEKIDVDLFWLQPVIIEPTRLDHPDRNQNFGGAWVTYRPQKGHAVDMYYLYLDNHNIVTTKGIATNPAVTHTIGTRYSGNYRGFLWDAEAMGQVGDRGGNPICAGSAAGGLGYNAKNLPFNPTVWAYYDWASGDRTPNAGSYSTFNQLYTFGHYYFGFLDLVGRQNIRDMHFHLYLNPTKWITLDFQYHFFSLDSSRDALYGAGAAPLRVDLTGNSGRVVGQELDIAANFHLTKNSDFFIGWSRLNSGSFISNTGNSRSPNLFYMMYNVRW